MIELIGTKAWTTSADSITAKIQQTKFDAFLVYIAIGGSGHALANLDSMYFNAILKNTKGKKDLPIMSSVRMSDFLRTADYLGGTGPIINTDYIAAKLPVGSYIVDGDDRLEVTITFGGHATATYSVRASLVSTELSPEKYYSWESIGTTATNFLTNDLLAAYLMSTADGSTYEYQDEVDSKQITDYELIALGNAEGKIEDWSSAIGVIYRDGYGIGQNTRLKTPASKQILICRQLYDFERKEVTDDIIGNLIISRLEKLRSSDPEKYGVIVGIEG